MGQELQAVNHQSRLIECKRPITPRLYNREEK